MALLAKKWSTAEILREHAAVESEDAAAAYRDLVIASVAGGETDPENAIDTLERAKKTVDEFEADCAWLEDRHRQRENIATAKAARVEAEACSGRIAELQERRCEVVAPIDIEINRAIEQRTSHERIAGKQQDASRKLTLTAPTWIENDRKESAKLLADTQNRVRHLEAAIRSARDSHTKATEELAELKEAVPKCLYDHPDGYQRENNRAIHHAHRGRVSQLEQTISFCASQFAGDETMLAAKRAEVARLQARLDRLGQLVREPWATPADLED